ncbi:MAG: hypothetical protein Q3979_08040 [Actinomycetaceae bacterium]|nr:hypothetical protein [Actinomycetaceae bacterium]
MSIVMGRAVEAAQADSGQVAVIRWVGIVAVAVGLTIIALRWWRNR